MRHRRKNTLSKATEHFKRFSRHLGRVPTLLYIFIYLILIVAFALIYDSLPNRSFYHATVQFEYDFLNDDANAILAALRNEITQTFVENYGSPKTNLSGWEADITELELHSLYVANFPTEISFVASLPITYTLSDGSPIWTRLTPTIVVPLRERMRLGNTYITFPSVTGYESLKFNLGEVIESPDPDVLFPYKGPGFESQATILPISSDLYRDIFAFGQGYWGFPTKVSGQFGRMLYFSTGIATSTALGDIVPLTPQARFLVTIETVISLVVITLILNAIGNDIADRIKNNAEDD